MAVLNTSNLSAMQIGRLNKALQVRARYSGEVRTLGQHVETLSGVKKEFDGMADWSRAKFNRMDGAQQREYEAKLKARRYYTIDGWTVPKIVYDAIT